MQNLKPPLFYTEAILSQLQQQKKLKKLLPLPLSYTAVKNEPISWMSSWFADKRIKQLFELYVGMLSRNDWKKQVVAEEHEVMNGEEERMEGKLMNTIKNTINTYNLEINIRPEIHKIKFVEGRSLSGVFIHRMFNMPEHCYSLQVDRKNKVYYRMRNKIRRRDDMAALDQKKSLYDEKGYFKVYIDDYQGWMNERFERSLYQVDATLHGEIRGNNSVKIDLPFNPQQPVTTHYMQIEEIIICNQPRHPIITDVDFFMAGNPHV